MLQKRTAAGLAQQETCKAKLDAKRAKRTAKCTERARIDALPLAKHYSDLKVMGVEDLRDQLKKHKLLGKNGFALSLPNRTAYVLQLQTLLLETNEDANDLEDICICKVYHHGSTVDEHDWHAKVGLVLKDFDMCRTSSFEYEPWPNPTKRHITLQEPMRGMHEHGGAGEEYWEYSFTQANLISNATYHRWGAADDNMTPHERKTVLGRPTSVSYFCLAYPRSPETLQGRKMESCAGKCIHLGSSPNKPGFRLGVLEGPRKGKLNTTTQVAFRETVLPLRAE
eukprot:6179568-Pleurochrysis_carterae.AAC.3